MTERNFCDADHVQSRSHSLVSYLSKGSGTSHTPQQEDTRGKCQSKGVGDFGTDIETIPTHHSETDSRHCQQGALEKTTSRIERALSRFRTSDSIPITPAPDGGARAWTTAILVHLVLLNTWGFINSFGLFQTYYVNEMKIGSDSAVSWIGTLQVFILFGMGTFSGRALDAGYFKPTFIIGSATYVFGMFMLSLCKTYWQVFLAQAICVGVGFGLVFVPSLALMSTYFDKKRSTALGITVSGSATGGLVFPAIAETLLPKIGFAWTIRVMAFVQLSGAIACAIFLKPRLPPRKGGPLVEWAAFKELPYTLYLIGSYFSFWGLYVGFYYVGQFGRNELGTSQSTSINLLLTMNGVGVIARIIPNFVANDLTGPVNLMIPYVIASGIILYCWIAVKNVTGLWIFAVLYGCSAAGLQGLFPVVLTRLTSDPKKAGVRAGMGFGVVGFAVLTGPPLAGALISRTGGSFVAMQIFSGSTMMIASVFVIACRWSKVGWKARVKI